MMMRYESADEIPDEAIADAFQNASFIKFSVVENNFLSNRKISIAGLGCWLPAIRVLKVLGITPQDLRPAFNPQHRYHLTRRLPEVPLLATPQELPLVVSNYNQLGRLRLKGNGFSQLAVIIGKPLELWLQFDEDGAMHRYLRTHLLNGQVLEDPFHFC